VATGLKVTLKTWLKRGRKNLRLAYARHRHAFGRAELQAGLERVGVRPGDALMVHSSFDRFAGFAGQPTDVIEVLLETVGPAGTVLMPTMPFDGLAVDYVASRPVFDVRRTPSRMGLITEWFRRWPGAVRSVHPTHPVAAWGARAEELSADHHRAETPCGHGSPWRRLLDVHGKVLMLGTDLRCMTFGHVSEVDLEQRFPFQMFTTERFRLQSKDHAGNLLETTTRLFNPALSRRRRLDRVIPVLKQHAAWHETHVGRLPLLLLAADEVTDAIMTLARAQVYCYDLPEEDPHEYESRTPHAG
jgi:aminoglycoside 3-N-acetyltransferase